ncbi:MAG: phosphate ABC transporter permease PstA [Bdellovibrionota bacterium]
MNDFTPTYNLQRFDSRRRWKNRFAIASLSLLTLFAILPFVSILTYVIGQGYPALNWGLLTNLPKPVGEPGGGIANALLGSIEMVALASVVGIPLGTLAGAYLSEFGQGKVATTLRFTCDLLVSVPSIIMGLFAYTLIVLPMKGFSAYAGAFALLMIQVPMVTRTTEEILKLVPQHLREAGLALGIPRWKVIIRIVLRGSLSGLTTGIMLALARIMGETAPLLFTAFNNRFWAEGLNQPTASLPVMIYTYAISPFDDWHAQAWAAALVLVLFVLLLNITTRLILGRRPESRH